jgi:hypothetical protein
MLSLLFFFFLFFRCKCNMFKNFSSMLTASPWNYQMHFCWCSMLFTINNNTVYDDYRIDLKRIKNYYYFVIIWDKPNFWNLANVSVTEFWVTVNGVYNIKYLLIYVFIYLHNYIILYKRRKMTDEKHQLLDKSNVLLLVRINV